VGVQRSDCVSFLEMI